MVQKIDLKRIKDARDSLMSLASELEQNPQLKIDSDRKKALHSASSLAYEASVSLTQIGQPKLQQVERYLKDLGYHVIAPPSVGITTTQMELFSARPEDRLSKDNLNQALLTLVAYENVMPWVDEVEKYRTVRGLDKILGDLK